MIIKISIHAPLMKNQHFRSIHNANIQPVIIKIPPVFRAWLVQTGRFPPLDFDRTYVCRSYIAKALSALAMMGLQPRKRITFHNKGANQ